MTLANSSSPSDLTIRYLMERAYQTSCEKGFHDVERSFATDIALMHSELSEALEEERMSGSVTSVEYGNGGKPLGAAYELADVIIRVCDVSERLGIDLEKALREKMDYNDSRPYLHGKTY